MHSGNYGIINCRCLCLISRGRIVRVARRICRGWMTRMWWRAAFVWVLGFSSLVIWTYQDEAKAVLKLVCACSQPDWKGALHYSFRKVETNPGGQVHVCLSILYLNTLFCIFEYFLFKYFFEHLQIHRQKHFEYLIGYLKKKKMLNKFNFKVFSIFFSNTIFKYIG